MIGMIKCFSIILLSAPFSLIKNENKLLFFYKIEVVESENPYLKVYYSSKDISDLLEFDLNIDVIYEGGKKQSYTNKLTHFYLYESHICVTDPFIKEYLNYDINFQVSLIPYGVSFGYDKEIINLKYHNYKHTPYRVDFSEEDNGKIVTSGGFIETYDVTKEEKYVKSFDRFIFNNFENLKVYEILRYYDIRYINFSYYNGNDNLLNAKCNFEFFDRYNIFQDFPLKGDSLYRYIPLKIVPNNDNLMHFEFDKNIYYNPNTFESSSYLKEGYVKTDKLYFPNKYEDELKLVPARIFMEIKGLTNFQLVGEFDITYINKFFSPDCSKAEYCIEKDVDLSTNLYETNIEVII